MASAAIWFHLVGARFRSELQYRTSFALIVLATSVFAFLDFVAVLAIFDRVDALGGWSFAEVALLYGTATVAFHLANVFVGGIDSAAEHIRSGTFDRLLLRPVGTVVQLVATLAARRFAYGPLGWSGAVSYIDRENVASIALARRLGCTEDPSAERFDPVDVVLRHPTPEARA